MKCIRTNHCEVKVLVKSKEKHISCPKYIINSVDTYNFLLELQRIIKGSTEQCIILDLLDTRVFETNLLNIGKN